MGDVATNFSRSEFGCRCATNEGEPCGFNAVDVKLLRVLQRIRDHFNKRVIITSGNRCKEYNKIVKSKDTSQHVRGMAADIKVEDVMPEDVARYVDEMLLQGTGGIGIYRTWVHIDVREKMSRWREND